MSQEDHSSPYSKFFKNDYLSDCTLETLEPAPETFKAHKMVIAANSEYFFKLFKEHPPKEGEKITLPKFIKSSVLNANQQNVFPKILEFFYSNQTAADLTKIGLTKENAFAFLNHFTGLEAVKGKHLTNEFIVKEVLGSANCADCLFDAVKANDKPLKEKCVETMVPIFSDLLNDSKQKLRFLGLPLEVVKEVLGRDDLKVPNENVLLNLVVDYIQIKEELQPKVAPPAHTEEKKPEPPKGDAPKAENKPAEEKKPQEEAKKEEKKGEAPKPEEKKPEAGEKKEEPKKAEEKPKEGEKPKEEPKKTEEKPKEGEKPKEEPKKTEEKPKEEPKKTEEKPKEGEKPKEEPKKEEKHAEEKKEATAAHVKVVDFEAEAVAKLNPYKLSLEEKRDLVKLLRLTHVSHEALIKAASLPIFAEFKDIFIETLSAKLNTYETAPIEKYSINTKPRAYTEPLSHSMVAPNQNQNQTQQKGTAQTGQPNQPTQLATPQANKDNKVINTPNKTASEQQTKLTTTPNKGVNQPQPQPQNSIRPAGPHTVSPQQTRNTASFSSPPRKVQPELYHSANFSHGGGQYGGDYGHHQHPFSQTMGAGQNMYQSVPRTYHQSPPRDNFYQTSPNRLYQHSPERTQQNFGYKSHEQSQGFASTYQSGGSGKKEQIRSPMRQSMAPITFAYNSDFDEHGVFYYLGTFGGQTQWQNPHEIGQVQAFFSSLGKGAIADLVGRDCVNCRTLNEPNSFMGVDLGVNRFLIPTCYTIRNRNSNHHVLLNWIVEASVDMKEWFCLDKRTHFSEDNSFNNMMETTREDLKQKGYMSTWGIDDYQVDKIKKTFEAGHERFFGFRYFRITQIGKNSSGSFNLALSGLEIYGVAFGENWTF